MTCHHHNSRAYLSTSCRAMLLMWVALVVHIVRPVAVLAQQSKPLVFDEVTVIDVEHGIRLPAQRVVVTGTRITAMGPRENVQVPDGAQVVDAKGKFMIPGLWDLHIHPGPWSDVFYSLNLANGVTGARDAGAAIPLDTLLAWRRKIMDGTNPGPVRLLFSGPQVNESEDCDRSALLGTHATCVRDAADARHVVDSLKAAGANIIKTYNLMTRGVYYAMASEARHLGIPFGGHLMALTAVEASDSGAALLDHLNTAGGLDTTCIDVVWWTNPGTASLARCRPVAERLAHNNTWFVPTVTIFAAQGVEHGARTLAIMTRANTYLKAFWSDTAPVHTGSANWLHGPVNTDTLHLPAPDSIGILRFAQKAGLPIATGVDIDGTRLKTLAPGFGVHQELAALVMEGMTPLAALQAGTLNPTKALRMTDSLGTITAGKLADFIVLDADPLVDITNTTTIQAVVANGRYFDRAALDKVLNDVRTSAMGKTLLRDYNP